MFYDVEVYGEENIEGTFGEDIDIPGDKSISQRVLLLGSIQPGTLRINNINLCGAVRVLIPALKQLGISVEQSSDRTLSLITPEDGIHSDEVMYINLGPSSAAARMIMAVIAGRRIRAIVDGDQVLRTRPMDWVVEPLNQLGCKISYLQEEGCLPIEIDNGELHDGEVTIKIGSAQAYSSILYFALAAGKEVFINRNIHSRDHTECLFRYISADVTESEKFIRIGKGVELKKLNEYTVPVDPSLVAYIVAGHIFQKRKEVIRIQNVCINPTRIGFFKVIQQSGVPVSYEDIEYRYGEKVATVVVGEVTGDLKPFIIDDDYLFHSMIDEIPLISAFATLIKEDSVIKGAEELIFKESNRILSTKAMIEAFGGSIEVGNDFIIVHGGKTLRPGVVDSFDDHRISMTAIVIASGLSGKSRIKNGTCYSTSFVNYDKCMEKMGIKYKILDV